MALRDRVDLSVSPLQDTSLLDAISAAVLATDLAGVIFYWNRAAEDLYGYPRSQMLGANVGDLLVRPDDREQAAEIMAQVLTGNRWTGEFPVRAADGRTLRVRVTDSPLWSDGKVVGVVGVADDVTAESVLDEATQLMSSRLGQLAHVTAELAGAPDAATVTEIVVSHASEAVGATAASLMLLDEDGMLVLAGSRGLRSGVDTAWSRFAVDTDTPAALAVREQRAVVVSSADDLRTRFPALADAFTEDRSLICLPVSVGRRPIGAIHLSFADRRQPDAKELEFLGTLADTCAQALERLRALTAAAERAAQLTFLAEASAELASSLDYQTTLRQVAQLAVPGLADWCAVEVVDDGRLRTLAVAHADPAKVAMAEELQRRYPSDPNAPTGSANVVRTGVSELYPVITDEMLVAGTRDEEHLRLSRDLRLCSALCVPLTARGRVLGALTLISAESGRQYGTDDVRFAEELARRAAVAIDNAQLHSETREAAIRLQRAVLPAAVPELPGWDVAAEYAPAGRTEVGGDFYDAIPLGDGRLVVVVGDVMGRGLDAAAAMAQMRAAVRAYVAIDPDPAHVLTKLDAMFAHYDIAQLVTLVYLVCDPEHDQMLLANAGHLPPYVIATDGAVHALDSPRGLPLGAGPDDRSSVVAPLMAGQTVLLYTDGLVERRGEDIDVGLDRLGRAAPALVEGPLPEALARLARELHDDARDDDVTALAVRRHPPCPVAE